MEDSDSDITPDEAVARTYSIELEDMRRLKNQVVTLKTALGDAGSVGTYKPPSTIIKAVSDIKTFLDDVEPDGYYTCASNTSSDFGYGRSLVCKDFVTNGCELALKQVRKNVKKLKDEGDISASLVSNFMENFNEEEFLESLSSKAYETMDEDYYFIFDFGSRMRKIATELLLKWAQDGLPKLKGKLESM